MFILARRSPVQRFQSIKSSLLLVTFERQVRLKYRYWSVIVRWEMIKSLRHLGTSKCRCPEGSWNGDPGTREPQRLTASTVFACLTHFLLYSSSLSDDWSCPPPASSTGTGPQLLSQFQYHILGHCDHSSNWKVIQTEHAGLPNGLFFPLWS